MYLRNQIRVPGSRHDRFRRQTAPIGNGGEITNTRTAPNITYEQKIINTFESLMQEGEGKIRLSENHKDAVLMIGNSGVGKSTLTLMLVGADLVSFKKDNSYLIKDSNKRICTWSTLDSCTDFPEMMLDNVTGTAFYDFPGFKDSRGTSQELAITCSIKKVVDHLRSVKFVFMANHSSLTIGNDRYQFMMLVKQALSLVRNIEKFKSSIMLIGNKVEKVVDNESCDENERCSPMTDDKIISAIGSFLEEAKLSLSMKLAGQSNLSSSETQFCNQAIKFIDILLEKEDGVYTRIGIFRKPTKAGPLNEMDWAAKEKIHIGKIIFDRLMFTEKAQNDFGYSISDTSKNDINVLVEYINGNIWSTLRNVILHMKDSYGPQIEMMQGMLKFLSGNTKSVNFDQSEALQFVQRINAGFNFINGLKREVGHLVTNKFVEKFSRSIIELGINGYEEEMMSVTNQGKYYEFLQLVSEGVDLGTRPWNELLQPLETYLSNVHKMAEEKMNALVDTVTEKVSKIVMDHYQNKMSVMEIHLLPNELQKGFDFIENVIQKFENLSTKLREEKIETLNRRNLKTAQRYHAKN